MNKAEIEKVVDESFDNALKGIRARVDSELYPAAFANQYSWLRVKAVFDLQNQAMRAAVKDALSQLLSE